MAWREAAHAALDACPPERGRSQPRRHGLHLEGFLTTENTSLGRKLPSEARSAPWLEPEPFRQCHFPPGRPTRARGCDGLQPSPSCAPAEVCAVPPSESAPQAPRQAPRAWPCLLPAPSLHQPAATGPHSAHRAAGSLHPQSLQGPHSAPAKRPRRTCRHFSGRTDGGGDTGLDGPPVPTCRFSYCSDQ